MNALFDIVMQAQGGQGVKTLAKQFGLSEAQVEDAVAQLMPAFSRGLKQNTDNPLDAMNFLGALASGRHGAYHDDPSIAFQADGVQEGNAILGHLFGSKDVSRALAGHVSASSGIGSAILKQMLPVIASMVLGGLFKKTSSSAGGGLGGILGGFLENMISGGAKELPRTYRKERTRRTGRTNPYSDNPLGKMMEDFLGGASSQQVEHHDPYARTSNREGFQLPQNGPSSGKDIFGDMFEPGREVPQQQRQDIESIFDRYLDGMQRR